MTLDNILDDIFVKANGCTYLVEDTNNTPMNKIEIIIKRVQDITFCVINVTANGTPLNFKQLPNRPIDKTYYGFKSIYKKENISGMIQQFMNKCGININNKDLTETECPDFPWNSYTLLGIGVI